MCSISGSGNMQLLLSSFLYLFNEDEYQLGKSPSSGKDKWILKRMTLESNEHTHKDRK